MSEIEIRVNPAYEFKEGVVAGTELIGFSTVPGTGIPEFGRNVVIGLEDFPDGASEMTLYAVWNKQCVLNFVPGISNQPEGSEDSYCSVAWQTGGSFQIESCRFKPPSETGKLFTYYVSDAWETVEDDRTVGIWGFRRWKYSFDGGFGYVNDSGSISLNGFNSASGVPVITFTAEWEPLYVNLPFMVGDEKYCDVLISTHNPQIPYPKQPRMVDGRTFIGWDFVEGHYIDPTESSLYIVCEDEGTTIPVVDSGEYVVCQNSGIGQMPQCVNARLGEESDSKFDVTFRFFNANGEDDSRRERVVQNTHIPAFHIHQTFTSDGKSYVFRYWKLTSGNISSSMTVLSDVVLDAVYDEIHDVDYGGEQPVPETTVIEPIEDERADFRSFTCQMAAQTTETGEWRCQLSNLNPRSCLCEWVKKCPFVNAVVQSKGQNNEFSRFTLIEIEDVERLLNALFKVNIDIAHREYFLKIDVPEPSNWWYGYEIPSDIVCIEEEDDEEDHPLICDDKSQIVCSVEDVQMVCPPSEGDEIVCTLDGEIVCVGKPVDGRLVSFEPTVEFKFSNFHSSNQIENGKLICSVGREIEKRIVPVNRELTKNCFHYSDDWYCYDYKKSLFDMIQANGQDETIHLSIDVDNVQKYYSVNPLHLYENSDVQSPTDVNDFVRHRIHQINRSSTQLRTFTSIVKKYRPVIMPRVRDIFDDCQGALTKYDADVNNDYGVFGWCTIPSKTMVNMEYNEDSIIVPSSYDCHNRIGGSNFLQMDGDLRKIYRQWIDQNEEDNAQNTWYYLYNTRDWTYFMKPFFNVVRNSGIYSYKLDTYPSEYRPKSSNHLNGVIFEPSNIGRTTDVEFGKIVETCQFLAKHHHGENNLKTISERYTNLVSYQKLLELTQMGENGFNSMYGSKYDNVPDRFRIPFQDWIDDFNKTGSFLDSKYAYNIGQAHAIDDFDEDSVWFYITMVEPLDDLNQVVELEDIMPFVFWWENRGKDNNGPTVECYGRQSSAKLNYEQGGWCYSSASEKAEERIQFENGSETKIPYLEDEQRWHAVQHTIGTDFSRTEYGGTILTMDNSGNVYKGAFDPNCSGTNEKWKIHHTGNAFGTNQNEDPVADKYYHGENAHGEGEFGRKVIPDEYNEKILDSVKDRPMTWNLWNVVRHYVYIRNFVNKNRQLGSQKSNWEELESRTEKIVKGIYRTFKQNERTGGNGRSTFGSIDGSSTNYGGVCSVRWTNSFVEISSILERNAREHHASFVLFTGDVPLPSEDATSNERARMETAYGIQVSEDLARARI